MSSFRYGLFVLILASSAFGAQFKFNGMTLTVPDGYTVEVIAAPPLVERPISASFDELGRLYVTDSAGMAMPTEKMLEVKPHRVLRLEDTQNNGHFDKANVFADKMMFPEGCLWFNGSLYVCAPPQIWKLTDTKNAGIADKREVWFDGKTLTHCANDLHGPYLGPDGRIYWCKGAFAKQTYEINGKPFETRASHIFRAKPDGTCFESVMTGGMDNPVGLTFNSEGERFLSCTFFQNPGGGRRDGLIHAIYGGVYGKDHDVLEGHPRTGELMPVLAHFGAAAPCGMTFVEAGTFDPDPALLTCCFNLHKVIISSLKPDGATYTTTQQDLISSDHADFHPTDVLQDADGSFIVVDTGGWYKICCPTSQLAKPDVLGAIYRVRKTDAPKVDDPRGLKLAWNKQSAEVLSDRLGDARPAVRRRATEALAEFNMVEDIEPYFAINKVLHSTSLNAQRSAIWVLCRMGDQMARALLHSFLNEKNIDPSVLQAATHAISVWRDRDVSASFLIRVLNEPLAVQRTMAEAAGRIAKDYASEKQTDALHGNEMVFLKAASLYGDEKSGHPDARRIFEHSLIYAMIEADKPKEIQPLLHSGSSMQRRFALIALDQMPHGDLKLDDVLPALNSADPAERDAAKWVATHHPEWGDALAKHFSAVLESEKPPADLDRTLASLAKAPAIQMALRYAIVRNDRPEARRAALRAMAQAGLRETPTGWLETLAEVIAEPEVEDLSLAIRTARALPQPKGGYAQLKEALLKIAHSHPSDALRLEALTALGTLDHPDAESFAVLLRNCASAQPLSQRLNALQVLTRAKLSVEQKRELAEALSTCGAMETQQLLPVFDKESSPEVGRALLNSLQRSPGRRGLRAASLRDALHGFPQDIQKEAAELLHSLDAATEGQAAHLQEVLAKLPPGDAQRGHIVFTSQKAGCTNCHAIGYLGGKLGPDLTGIGKTRTERDLLESIVYPSASFVRSYEPYMVVTNSGQRFNGILRKDSSEEIVLATGPQTEERIPRADVKQMQPSPVSLMPDGFETLLTLQELADVVAYLKGGK